MICNYFPEPSWLLFTPDLPSLLYYSHIPTIVLALLMGFFVFLNGRKILLNQLLFAITVCFSFWVFFSLIAWTNIRSDLILSTWVFFYTLSGLISILSIYFIHVFVSQKDITASLKALLLTLILPLIILAPTNLNISGFDISVCDAYKFEGGLYFGYAVFLSVLALLWVLFVSIRGYKTSADDRRSQIAVMGMGMSFFLFTFFSITFLISYLTTAGVLGDSQLEMYGLFGMDIFAIVLAYLIVKFKAFKAKLLTAQALVISLILLVGSLAFFETSRVGDVIVGITFVLACIGGYFLVRSVKREVEQREQIEKLATNLEKANERLKELDKMKSEFVSIASHQLRSPITAIRGYVSMLVEGSYGKFPDKAQEVLARIGESSKFMATSIEDYLNVSRIEAGNMKYELSDFNLKEQAEKVSDELRQTAMKKGLVLWCFR